MLSATQSQKKLIDAVQFPATGRYVVAVSGGVDSAALLDILSTQSENLDLIVAHFDHGWRTDSHLDAELVRSLSLVLNLPFYVGFAQAAGSEAEARRQRYDFLHSVAALTGSAGIITAHHLDDRIETSLFNTLRGTARRGRSATLNRQGVLRPLSRLSKTQLHDYAKGTGLPWREDSTNRSLTIPRNFLRHEVIPAANELMPFDQICRDLIDRFDFLGQTIERRIEQFLSYTSTRTAQGLEIKRDILLDQPLHLIAEVLAHAIRRLEPGLQVSKERIKDLALAVKTARNGTTKDIAGRLKLRVGYDRVAVVLPRPGSQKQPGKF